MTVLTETAQPDKSAWTVRALLAAFVVLVVTLPWYGNNYVIYMATLIAINVIATMGLNITVGYTGLLSVGHAAFVGVGAYICALLSLRGFPIFICIGMGAAAAFVAGVIFGLPALRIKGVHLAIATLAAQFTLYFIFQRWTSVTNGDNGLQLPQTSIFGFVLNSETRLYFFVLPFAVLLCIAASNLFKTRVGRAFIAVRERDYAASVLGIDVTYYKLLAFAIGAAYAGVAGALLAIFLRLVNPDQFLVSVSIFFLAAVLVGGRGSVLGSVLGAAFMTMIPELLRLFAEWSVSGNHGRIGEVATLREVAFGALIVIFLHLDPRGLVGLIEKLGIRIEFRGGG
jgi:branched-chain amino acid transport system permease protein